MNLLHTLLTSPFLIEEQAAVGYLPLILNILEGKSADRAFIAESRKAEAEALVYASLTHDNIKVVHWQDDAEEKDTIYVPRLIGAVSKNSQMCGPAGTIALARNIQAADENPNIRAIVLNTDTPGGEVANTDVLANVIANTKKPFITFGSGLVCSAGIWITAASDYIFSSSPLDKWGSIGVVNMLQDYSKYYEAKGIKFHEIYATLSTDKNSDYKNILSGKYDEYRTNTLDVINKAFHSFVKEHRDLSDDSFTGKTFLGDEAKKRGFFDEYGSLNDAIIKAYELGTNTNNKKTIYVG